MADPQPPPDHTTERSSGASSYDPDPSPTTTYDSSTTGTTGTRTETARTSGGISGSRHMTSVLLALVLVPAGYVLVDHSFYRAVRGSGALLEGGRLSTEVIVTMGIAAACLFAAAATGRISALGPLVAGLVWGAAPAVWVMLDYASYTETVRDLPNLYDDFGLGLVTAGFALFPAVAGLLLGTAVAGRWRGSR